MHILQSLLPLVLSSTCYALSYFPPRPTDVTIVKSKSHPQVSISYKETTVCETTPGVKSYAGHVHLPASLLRDSLGLSPSYNLNTFFWFVPARNSPESAPLSIWIDGGPGQSGLVGATNQNGPCYVTPDGKSTTLNQWSFNNHVNMLYIDQPNQVGFSYDRLVNATVDLVAGTATPHDFSNGPPFKPNVTNIFGTLSSQDIKHTANNSIIAAKTMWHVAQAWYTVFPNYKPANDKISLWTNSYGGFFGPAIFSYFESQNRKIQSGQITDAACLHLDTLGLTNSCIDFEAQFASYPNYAYNNTYGLQLISKKQANSILNGPCLGKLKRCRALAAEGDPDFNANNQTVNAACLDADETCIQVLALPTLAGRSVFDIATKDPDPYSVGTTAAFFNQRHVQQDLGVALNFTEDQNFIAPIFLIPGTPIPTTSDAARITYANLQSVLDANVKVAMVYGDRDHRCNWIGAENVSLAVPYHARAAFNRAGYADLRTNASYTGGVVRQHGGFSFSRVFEAGHAVGYYQPETVYNIFMRAMFNMDVATGTVPVAEGSAYSTKGPASSWGFKNKLPPSPGVLCNIRSVSSCTDNQLQALEKGTAVVRDDIVVSPKM